MPFYAEEHVNIPTKDILSWYFDDPSYDLDATIYVNAEDTSDSYTAKEAKTAIRKLVAGFRALGLKKGDTVCIHSFNDVQYPILVNGIIGFGGIFSGTNPSYQAYELAHAIKTAEVKCIIAEPDLMDAAAKAAKDAGLDESKLLLFDTKVNSHTKKPGGNLRSWKWLFEHGEEDWVRFDDLETSRNTTAARLFSSGTTGLPKAGILTHYNFIGQHVLINEWNPKPYTQRRFQALPMFHVASVPGMHFSPLKNGIIMFILRRFELEPYLRNIERHQITDMATVPPIVIGIIMSPASKKYSLKSVKYAHCGAAPLEKGPQAKLQALLNPDAPFTQVWGMTETTCIATMFPYPEDDDTGAVGYPLPGLDVKLVDDDGNDITGDDVRGEFCVRGPTVIPGYLDKEATAGSWDKDNYFHTGDVAYRDGKTKKWYIVDRKKELIKVRGFQVAPPELEGLLISNPKIGDAAVIGVKPQGSDGASEFPRAYIVPREGETITEDEVKKFIADRLSSYKRLEGGVKILSEIPRNPSGKILKRILREQAAKEMGAKL